jgi:DNA-binding protein HU-beta
MNKSQLIEGMADHSGLTKTEAKKALNAFIKTATHALKAGDKLTLVGFGSFSLVHKPERAGRNPRTGHPIKILARKSVKFKPGTELLNHVHPVAKK